MTERIDHHRRRLFGAAAVTLAAAPLGADRPRRRAIRPAAAPRRTGRTRRSARSSRSMPACSTSATPKRVPPDGPVVILLHGWPYDIHSFVDVAPLLAAPGYRVIVPYLRGYGTTRFLSARRVRNGQQAALAADIIALMDALGHRRRRSSPGSTGARAPRTSWRRCGRSAARRWSPSAAI